MRHLAPLALALALTACTVPGRPGLPGDATPGPGTGVIGPNGGSMVAAGGGNIVGNAGGNVVSAPAASAAPAASPEDEAYAAVTAAVTEAVLGGAPAEGAKAEAPFTTLAVGDRLGERLGSPEEIQARLQGKARGTFQVDLTKLGTTTAVSKTSAEPAAATLVKYLGAGTEPLHGLSTELRGVTVDRAAKTLRSQIAEKQGVVLLGGKNLFGRGPYAKLPVMKDAVAAGFGAEGTAGTQVSYAIGVTGPADAKGTLTLRYDLTIASETVPQVAGDFTLKLTADQAAQALTMELTGPYTVTVPGGQAVLVTGTLAKARTTTLTEAKASFLAAVASLQALK